MFYGFMRCEVQVYLTIFVRYTGEVLVADMTLLVSWVAVDSRKPSAIYLLSDSRISWSNNKKYDYGRKVFASQNTPNIFGYCGDVVLPSILLNQLIDIIDLGLFFKPTWNYRKKVSAVIKHLKEAFNKYPHSDRVIMGDSLEIIYGTRDDDATFHCIDIIWKRQENKWRYKSLPIHKKSYQLRITGSGKSEFNEIYNSYIQESEHQTSRAVFQTFCDTLRNITDKHCGGAPQLVGIYSKPFSPAKTFGIIYDNRRYVLGLPLDSCKNVNPGSIEWRNELFEISDPISKKRKPKAQPQPYK